MPARDPEATHHLDVKGTLCPVPLLLTRQLVRDLPAGAIVKVVGDDPEMVQDFSDWSLETTHRLLKIDRADPEIHCWVEVVSTD